VSNSRNIIRTAWRVVVELRCEAARVCGKWQIFDPPELVIFP